MNGGRDEHRWCRSGPHDRPLHGSAARRAAVTSTRRPVAWRATRRTCSAWSRTPRARVPSPSARASRASTSVPAACRAVAPPTWGRSTPRAWQKAPSSGATVAGSYGASGSAGETPKPGRSTAMTSRSTARTGTAGSQAWRWWPMRWSSSGAPAPVRSYATDAVHGPRVRSPRGDSRVKETVAGREMLPGVPARGGLACRRLRQSGSNNCRQVDGSSRWPGDSNWTPCGTSAGMGR